MGATSAQGWYLFIFLVGFTLGPAGLAGLGWLVALVGFALIAVALAGFYRIKEPDSAFEPKPGSAKVGQQRPAKSY